MFKASAEVALLIEVTECPGQPQIALSHDGHVKWISPVLCYLGAQQEKMLCR